MKKLFFLLCIGLLLFIVYHSIHEPLELMPLEHADPTVQNNMAIKYPTKIDRIDCSGGYQYCYNGEFSKKDIFGNSLDLEGEPYTYGTTYASIPYQKVYLKDYTTNVSGSSKTRDVHYDTTTCSRDKPWHLKLPFEAVNYNYHVVDISQCYSKETEASYYYDKYIYKYIGKYPFSGQPLNPEDAQLENTKVRLKKDTQNIVYSVPLCSIDKPLYANNQCHSITENVMDDRCNTSYPYIVEGSCVDYASAIAHVTNGCTQKEPYKYNGVCYGTIDEIYKQEYILDSKQGDICFLRDGETSISCEDLDVSMLYNPITNNYISQLNDGDYSYIDCSGSLTKCVTNFPYEKKNDTFIPVYSAYPTQRNDLPEYPVPEPYKEPTIAKYINPYNSDIENSLYILCKHNYSTIPQENMCPKELPICKGNINQLGFCNETLESKLAKSLSCKNNYSTIPKKDMCPYNLPYCEDNVCKESSLFRQ